MRKYRAWTEEEDKILRECAGKMLAYEMPLERTREAIVCRARNLGLPMNTPEVRRRKLIKAKEAQEKQRERRGDNSSAVVSCEFDPDELVSINQIKLLARTRPCT